MSNPQTTPPTPEEAIKFAITIDDHYDRLEFLIAYDKQENLIEWLDDFEQWKRTQ